MNPSVSPNPVTDVRELLTYPFMVHALQAGTIVAVMAAVVGWFVVLRREAFAAHTLSVMSFPGASGAALLGVPAAAGYFTFCTAAACVIAAGSRVRGRHSHSQESALVGTVGAAGFALGFLFLALYQGVLESLETLLFGSFLGVTSGEVLTLLIVALAVLAFLALAGRPLLFASVDADVAAAAGVRAGRLSVAFLIVLGLAVAATAQITGVLLVYALLVAPAASASVLTTRIGWGLAVSVVLALVTVWVGLGLAYFTNRPVGFLVSTVAFVLYLGARGVSAARGAGIARRAGAARTASPARGALG